MTSKRGDKRSNFASEKWVWIDILDNPSTRHQEESASTTQESNKGIKRLLELIEHPSFCFCSISQEIKIQKKTYFTINWSISDQRNPIKFSLQPLVTIIVPSIILRSKLTLMVEGQCGQHMLAKIRATWSNRESSLEH